MWVSSGRGHAQCRRTRATPRVGRVSVVSSRTIVVYLHRSIPRRQATRPSCKVTSPPSLSAALSPRVNLWTTPRPGSLRGHGPRGHDHRQHGHRRYCGRRPNLRPMAAWPRPCPSSVTTVRRRLVGLVPAGPRIRDGRVRNCPSRPEWTAPSHPGVTHTQACSQASNCRSQA